MKIFFLAAALFALTLPAPAAAAPAISCHCFRDRSFDPARPAAVDPYLLATTQNSLIAAVFDLNKKELVKAKMAGVPGDVLWVAHYLADRTGGSASQLMAAYQSGGSWQAAIVDLDQSRLGLRFAELLKANPPDEALAAAAADEIVTARLGTAPADLIQIRAQGGGNAEMIVAAYLGRKQGRSPLEIYREVSAGRATWGEMLNATGTAAGSIEEDLRRFVQ